MPAWIRSAITTLLVTFIGLIPVAAVSNLDFSWLGSAAIAAALAAVRTLVVALNPLDDSYGVVKPAPVEVPADVVFDDPESDEGYHPDDLAEGGVA